MEKNLGKKRGKKPKAPKAVELSVSAGTPSQTGYFFFEQFGPLTNNFDKICVFFFVNFICFLMKCFNKSIIYSIKC
jgi:hypothetical protein